MGSRVNKSIYLTPNSPLLQGLACLRCAAHPSKQAAQALACTRLLVPALLLFWALYSLRIGHAGLHRFPRLLLSLERQTDNWCRQASACASCKAEIGENAERERQSRKHWGDSLTCCQLAAAGHPPRCHALASSTHLAKAGATTKALW